MTQSRHLRGFIVLLTLLMFVGGCRKSPNPLAPSPAASGLQSLRIEGPSVFSIGQSAQLKALVRFTDGSEQEVTNQTAWAACQTNVASISGTGLLQALAAGDCSVTGTYVSLTGQLAITINGPGGSGGGGGPTVQSLSLNGNTSIQVGQTSPLTATAHFSDGTTQNVTAQANWSSADNGIATAVGGLLTGINPGNTTVTAMFGGRSAQAPVSVTGQPGTPTVTAVTISGNTSIQVGQTSPLTATAYFSDGTTQNVTAQASWSSADSGIATVPGGLLTGVNSGNTTVTAIFGGQSAQAPVSIAPGQGGAPDLIGLELDVPINLSVADILNGNPILNLRLYGLYSDGSKSDLTNACVSTGCVTSPTGLLDVDAMGTTELVLLLVQGLLNPNHQINATYGGYTANANVTITNIPVLNDLQILGGTGASIGLGSSLPSVQGFLSGGQGLSSELGSNFPGLTYSLQPGGVLAGILSTLGINLGDLLQVTNGVLGLAPGAGPLLNTVVALLGGGGVLPVQLSAAFNGVVSAPIAINVTP